MPILEIPLRSLGQTVRLDTRRPRRGVDPEAWQRACRQVEYWHRKGEHRRLILHLVRAKVLCSYSAARADLRHEQPNRWPEHSDVYVRRRELERLLWSPDIFASEDDLDSMPPVTKERRRGPLVIVLPSGRTLTLRASEPPEGVEPSVWRNAIRRVAWQVRHDSHDAIFRLVIARALTPNEGAHELVAHQRQRGLETRDFESFLPELRYLRDQPLPPPHPPRPRSLWRHLERAAPV